MLTNAERIAAMAQRVKDVVANAEAMFGVTISPLKVTTATVVASISGLTAKATMLSLGETERLGRPTPPLVTASDCVMIPSSSSSTTRSEIVERFRPVTEVSCERARVPPL